VVLYYYFFFTLHIIYTTIAPAVGHVGEQHVRCLYNALQRHTRILSRFTNNDD